MQKRIPGYWQSIPEPATIPDRQHLRRQIRYVALNPCRKKLCADPLEWYWSTYREIVGSTAMSTVQIDSLITALGESRAQFNVRFHSYMSGDPSVDIRGTPLPRLLSLEELKLKLLDEILIAASAALRVPPSDVCRKGGELRILFVQLAVRHGWRCRIKLVSSICGIHPSAIPKIFKKPSHPGIRASELCLSDRRPHSGASRPAPAAWSVLTSQSNVRNLALSA